MFLRDPISESLIADVSDKVQKQYAAGHRFYITRYLFCYKSQISSVSRLHAFWEYSIEKRFLGQIPSFQNDNAANHCNLYLWCMLYYLSTWETMKGITNIQSFLKHLFPFYYKMACIHKIYGSVSSNFVCLEETVTQVDNTTAIHVQSDSLTGEKYTFLNTLTAFAILEFSWLWMILCKHTRAVISECTNDEYPLTE